MLFGISSGKNTRVTSQASYLGSSPAPAALNRTSGQPLISAVHSADNKSTVSIQHSFVGNLESTNAYHAKQELHSFGPQLGLEHITLISECLTNLSEFSHVNIPDHLLKEVEGLTALFLSLKDCVSVTQFTSIVFLYVRSHCESSVSSKIISYLSEVFASDEFVQQSSSGQPEWLSVMRNVQQNWSLVKGNKAFRQLSKLLGVLVMLGLCDAADLQFDIAGFKLFDSKLLETHLSAFDIVDALLGTVTFFAEGVYKCFQTGSIRPLLINDQAALDLDEEFALLTSFWPLVKCGNLERVMKITDQEFGSRVRLLHTDLSNLVVTLKGIDRKLVSDKLMKILAIKHDLVTFKISSGVRKAPFAVELFGKSNQGKTTFGDQLVDALLTSAGLPTGKEYRAVLNASDKFMSNWTSDKLVAIVDDMAQEKSAFVEKAPTRMVIDVCNNQMYYAPKADLESKGKSFVEPEIFLVNANVKHLESYMYSNCPYAVQRRLVLVFTVACKNEFQLKDAQGRNRGVDSGKVREHYTIDGVYTPQPIEDIWNITIEYAVEPEKLTSVASYSTIQWRGKNMENVSASEAIACACEYYKDHRINQDALMAGMQARENTLTRCHVNDCCFMEGHCPDHEPEILPDKEEQLSQQFGLEFVVAAETLRRKITRRATRDSDTLLGKLDTMATSLLYKHANKFALRWDWICLLPAPALDNKYFRLFALWAYSDDVSRNYTKYMVSLWALCLLCSTMFPLFTPLFLGFALYQQMFCMSMIERTYLNELKKRNDVFPEILKRSRDTYAKEICCTVAGIGALYVCARMYKSWKSLKPIQGSLEPTTAEDIAVRDTETNVWADVVQRSLPVSDKVKTTTWQQLSALVRKNLVYGTIVTTKDNMMCNLLFIKSNVVLVPNHYFEDEESLAVICYKENADSIGGSFKTRLCKTSSVHIPDTDLRLCYTSTGGSFKDLTDYFPCGQPGDLPFEMNWRRKNGELVTTNGKTIEKRTSNTIATFMGGEYANLGINTFGGLCGAPLVSQTNHPMILGIHVGGATGTPRGCFGLLTQSQISCATTFLRKVEGVLLTGNVDKFTPQVLGVSILTGKELHPKSPLNYLPHGSQVSYHGSCPGATSSYSSVRTTPISGLVEEIAGVPNIWGAPKMKPEWLGWQKCLAHASDPGTPFPHSLLAVAVADYKKPMVALIKTSLWNSSKPLTDHENLCGTPGKKFLDAINLNTSIGFPLTGPKRKFVQELEPTADKPNNRILDPVIMDEIARVEDMYANGYRAFTVAKACKKDEVLPTAKEKVRIFFGNSISFVWLLRKYNLPILRFMQMNPLLSECAVGINSHGPEWDEFHKHASAHGMDRLFGGDYGKYDQKLPSQLIIASLRILIDLARECNYSERDLKIMEAMAGDLAYALIAFNGDLVSMSSGTHISGNSLTVIVNGISGSLNLRVFFYSVYAHSIAFRSAANMVTYGDDNMGSVSPKYPLFNIKDCSAFLASYGQTYTMPDKTSELQEYLEPDQFEFLKRESVYHPRLGVHVGALARDSIYKSLHCFLRPKGHPLTEQQAVALNLDTGLREFFNHGKIVYEYERTIFKEIAEKAEITHMCSLLDDTYEDRVDEWFSKYRDVYNRNGSQEITHPEYAFV
jgi:hypothetical protein